MNTDSNTMVLEEERQILSVEELAFNLPMSEVSIEENAEDLYPDMDPDPGQLIEDSSVLLEIISEQVGSKRIWQIVTACLITSVVVAAFICVDLYAERKTHIEKISQGQTNLQLTQAKFLKAAGFEAQLVKSNGELTRVQNELTGSRAELTRAQGDLKKSETGNLQRQLTDTTQRLEALQSRNAKAVKQLSERLRKLSD